MVTFKQYLDQIDAMNDSYPDIYNQAIHDIHDDLAKNMSVFNFIKSLYLQCVRNDQNVVERDLYCLGIDFREDYDKNGIYKYKGKFEGQPREVAYYYYYYLEGKYEKELEDGSLIFICNEQEAEVFKVEEDTQFRLIIDDYGFVSGEWLEKLNPDEEFEKYIKYKTKKVAMGIIHEVVYVKQFGEEFKLAINSIDKIPEDEDFEESQVYLSLGEALLDAHEKGFLVKII